MYVITDHNPPTLQTDRYTVGRAGMRLSRVRASRGKNAGDTWENTSRWIATKHNSLMRSWTVLEVSAVGCHGVLIAVVYGFVDEWLLQHTRPRSNHVSCISVRYTLFYTTRKASCVVMSKWIQIPTVRRDQWSETMSCDVGHKNHHFRAVFTYCILLEKKLFFNAVTSERNWQIMNLTGNNILRHQDRFMTDK